MQRGGVRFAAACVLRERLRRVFGLGSEPGGVLGTEELDWVGSGGRWRVAALPSWTWTLAVVHICKASVRYARRRGHGRMQWLR